jgi:predicted DNA-binding transcriptional regulator AlpA
MTKLQDTLAYPPRGMDADRAAAYCGVSKTKFLEGVESGTFPRPKDVDGAPRWDRVQLDAAWDALNHKRRSPVRPTLAELQEQQDGQGGTRLRQ